MALAWRIAVLAVLARPCSVPGALSSPAHLPGPLKPVLRSKAQQAPPLLPCGHSRRAARLCLWFGAAGPSCRCCLGSCRVLRSRGHSGTLLGHLTSRPVHSPQRLLRCMLRPAQQRDCRVVQRTQQ